MFFLSQQFFFGHNFISFSSILFQNPKVSAPGAAIVPLVAPPTFASLRAVTSFWWRWGWIRFSRPWVSNRDPVRWGVAPPMSSSRSMPWTKCRQRVGRELRFWVKNCLAPNFCWDSLDKNSPVFFWGVVCQKKCKSWWQKTETTKRGDAYGKWPDHHGNAGDADSCQKLMKKSLRNGTLLEK